MSGPPEEMKSLYMPKLAELTHIESLSEREKLFRMRLIDGSRLNYTPGQFVQVGILGIGEAPISVSSSPTRDDAIEIGVRAVGNVTRALHRQHPGDTVTVRGPFGNGFPLADLQERDLLFVAGGTGLCPLRSMIQYAVDKRDQFGKLTILYGCREPAEQIFREELAEWRQREDIEILESVDRCPLDVAWEGTVGVITTCFPLMDVDHEKTTAIMVGPPIMYRYVIEECLNKRLPRNRILVSLERRMRCGMGFCGHCQINNTYVCLEGPVFNYEQLGRLKETEV
jgi:NAD(P)H-flavin reductase